MSTSVSDPDNIFLMFGAPASGTPERSARREFELLLLLGGNRKGAVQLWKWERRQRIYANAQQSAGRPATEAKGSRGAAEHPESWVLP